MIEILLEGHEAVTRTARKAFPATEKADDQPTMDLWTQRAEVHDEDGLDASKSIGEIVRHTYATPFDVIDPCAAAAHPQPRVSASAFILVL